MCANKPNINLARDKMNYNNQTKIIPFDIEYIMLISNTIYTIKCIPDIGKACPSTCLRPHKPFF